MRLPFQVYAALDGNLNVMDGVVIDQRTGVIFETSGGGDFSHDAPARTYDEHTALTAAGGALFTGGSGRNLVCAGGLVSGLAESSFFRPEVTDHYRDGEFLLVVTAASTATISDAYDVVAELTTGGAAPIGNYALTSYGQSSYNGSTAGTLVITAEEGGPGAIPAAICTISAGSAQGGSFTPLDASNYVSAEDPNWTIALQPGGEGLLLYLTTIVAVRAVGTAFDPSGRYEAVEAAYPYNPVEPVDDELADELEINPFGTLTVVYSWPATPDLDTRTEFLSAVAGFRYSTAYAGPVGDYMTWSGDNIGPAGSETVVINLGLAWTDAQISTFADIRCGADWYPSAGGHGPATLLVTYDLGAGPVTLYSGPIYPGSGVTPARTAVKTLRILADGTLEALNGPWAADVRRVAQPPRAGTVYLRLTETAGALTAVTGPFFATTQPTNTTGVFHYPLAISDGVGGIRQLHTGAIQWQATGLVFGTVAVASDPTITAAGFTHQVPATDPAGAVWLLPAVAAVTPTTNQDGTTPLNEDSTPQTDE